MSVLIRKKPTRTIIEEVFPKGPLGPILGAPKQFEPPCQDRPRSWGGDRFNSNALIFDDDDKTNKAMY